MCTFLRLPPKLSHFTFLDFQVSSLVPPVDRSPRLLVSVEHLPGRRLPIARVDIRSRCRRHFLVRPLNALADGDADDGTDRRTLATADVGTDARGYIGADASGHGGTNAGLDSAADAGLHCAAFDGIRDHRGQR